MTTAIASNEFVSDFRRRKSAAFDLPRSESWSQQATSHASSNSLIRLA